MPYHSSEIAVSLVHTTANVPWDEQSLKDLLTSNRGKGLRKFNPQDCLGVWKMPKATDDQTAYLLRQSHLSPLASEKDQLELYVSELERLASVGKRHDLANIIAPLAMFHVSGRSVDAAYTVVQYIDDGQTLDEAPKSPIRTEVIQKLGRTLTDYLEPGADAYLVDVANLHQFSPAGTYYDYDVNMLARGEGRTYFGPIAERKDLSEWFCENS